MHRTKVASWHAAGLALACGISLNLAGCGSDEGDSPNGFPGEPTGTENRWTALGPEGGDVTWLGLAADGAMTTVAGGRNLYRRDETSGQWRKLGTPDPVHGPSCRILDVALDPKAATTLYVATQCTPPIGIAVPSVFKSTDEGKSWSPSSRGLPSTPFDIFDLAIHPTEPAILYIASGDGILYRSGDAGANWTALERLDQKIEFVSPDPRDARALVVGGDYIFCYEDGAECGLLSSSDGGRHWTRLQSKFKALFLERHPTRPEVLFTGNFQSTLISTDGGRNWRSLGLSQVSRVIASPAEPDTYYALGRENDRLFVAKSTNAGASWQKTALEVRGSSSVIAAESRQAGAVDVGSTLGVLRSPDGVQSWKQNNSGLVASGIRDISASAAQPSRVWVIGDGYEILGSEDWGQHWLDLGMQAVDVEADARDGRTLYALDLKDVLKSVDGGQSWASISGDLPRDVVYFAKRLLQDPDQPGLLYLITDGFGVFSSTDGGAHWSSLNDDLEALLLLDPATKAFALQPGKQKGVYAVFQGSDPQLYPAGSRFFRSSDDGRSWTPIPGLLDGIEVYSLAASSKRLLAGTERGLYSSDNQGSSWSLVELPVEAESRVFSVAMDAADASWITVATEAGGAYSSSDGGRTWHALSSEPSKRSIRLLHAHPGRPGRIYGGSPDNGLFTALLTAQ